MGFTWRFFLFYPEISSGVFWGPLQKYTKVYKYMAQLPCIGFVLALYNSLPFGDGDRHVSHEKNPPTFYYILDG